MGKTTFALAAVGTVAVVALLGLNMNNGANLAGQNKPLEVQFRKYLAEQGKSYLTKEEYNARYQVFEAKFMKIIEHNSKNDATFTVGTNQFTDMSDAEIRQRLGFIPAERELKLNSAHYVKGGDKIDWTSADHMNPVQDQGQCGSCWAFSTTAAAESHRAISKKGLKKHAEQQLVDCSTWNNGCGGGNIDFALDYIMTEGMKFETEYPYHAKDETCKYTDKSRLQYNIDSYADVEPENEEAFLSALSTGPLSVAIEADTWAFQSYNKGILNDAAGCGTQLDHAVLAVGYNRAEKSILVRNSWGARWGEKGYIRMAMTGNGSGMCGIYMMAAHPVMN